MSHRAEELHLAETLAKIGENIALLEANHLELEKQIKEFYQSYHSDDEENTSDLYIGLDKQRLLQEALAANRKAQDKTYFGKISYLRPEDDATLYIGKRGISDQANRPEMLITDWRAPVSELYYNAALGDCTYNAPGGLMTAKLTHKSTLEVNGGHLDAVYDSEVVANDALLTQYLSRNKDVVLNEIVATIQKEQNDIIRVEPWRSVLVQGVAGSGKTTVAMHRISWLLYNYADKLGFENIYVAASSRLFLGYITAMLPDLEVPEIQQGTLAELLFSACEMKPGALKPWALTAEQEGAAMACFRQTMRDIEQRIFKPEPVVLFGLTLLTEDDVAATGHRRERSLSERAAVLDRRIGETLTLQKERVIDRIVALRNDAGTVALARKLFGIKGEQVFEVDLQAHYRRFTNVCKTWFAKQVKALKPQDVANDVMRRVGGAQSGLSLSGLALTALARARLDRADFTRKIKHIVVDEAQDFSAMVYHVLRGVFSQANFTIVGDVCQNIVPTGLNDWRAVREEAFGGHLHFAKLTKSYRNTIEISNFANRIAAAYFDSDFMVEPVVRHGKDVAIHANAGKLSALRGLLPQLSDYTLTAVVCKTAESAKKLAKAAGLRCLETGGSLEKGCYAAALADTKGLEFDAVVIWDYDDYRPDDDALDAKRLYVAMTRALHELHLFSDSDIIE